MGTHTDHTLGNLTSDFKGCGDDWVSRCILRFKKRSCLSLHIWTAPVIHGIKIIVPYYRTDKKNCELVISLKINETTNFMIKTYKCRNVRSVKNTSSNYKAKCKIIFCITPQLKLLILFHEGVQNTHL